MYTETLDDKKGGLESSSVGNDGGGAENNGYDNGDNGVSVTGAILADDMGTGKVVIMCIYTCIYIYMYQYKYIYVCVCMVYIYIYIYIMGCQ
jgi:hypothetical protein